MLYKLIMLEKPRKGLRLQFNSIVLSLPTSKLHITNNLNIFPIQISALIIRWIR